MPIAVLIGGALVIWSLWPSGDGRIPWLSWFLFALTVVGALATWG